MKAEEIKERLNNMLKTTDDSDYQEALKVATELVERNIPKRLELEMIFICPSCGIEVESKTMTFCQNCGQRFGQEEEE